MNPEPPVDRFNGALAARDTSKICLPVFPVSAPAPAAAAHAVARLVETS